ncbi:TPA: hypothetical protein JBI80_15285 [Legionella pneumophila]|nr:hypothetical protein [Legionella pneumophila]
MFERINLLITTHDFGFQSWFDNYGKGVWACVSPNEFLLDEIRNSTSDGDCAMIDATNYFDTTNWLPFVTGNDFIDAMNTLENLLATIPSNMLHKDSTWSSSISTVLSNLQEMRRTNNFNLYQNVPRTLDELLSHPERIDELKMER